MIILTPFMTLEKFETLSLEIIAKSIIIHPLELIFQLKITVSEQDLKNSTLLLSLRINSNE